MAFSKLKTAGMLVIYLCGVSLLACGRESKTGDLLEKSAQNLATRFEDATITTVVNAVLITDPVLSTLRIHVNTHQGEVNLNGTAPDHVSYERISRVVAAVQGVKNVRNKIQINI